MRYLDLYILSSNLKQEMPLVQRLYERKPCFDPINCLLVCKMFEFEGASLVQSVSCSDTLGSTTTTPNHDFKRYRTFARGPVVQIPQPQRDLGEMFARSFAGRRR